MRVFSVFMITFAIWIVSADASNGLDLEIEHFEQSVVAVSEKLENLKNEYVHNDMGKELDRLAVHFQVLEEEVISTKEKEKLFFLRLSFLRHLGINYSIVRYFNEGSYENLYPENFYENLRVTTIKLGRAIEKEKKDSLKQELDLLKELEKYRDRRIEKMGNEIVKKVVDKIGVAVKKRKFVPSMNRGANFRDNYLFTNQDSVLDSLLKDDGMQIGDIILEKDMKANSDAIIPGYWTHASIYLGTIEEFRTYGIWNKKAFLPIRKSIQKYLSNQKKKARLKALDKLKEPFEKIAWYIESGREGVEVFPLRFFLQTDGMAVLRPNINSAGHEWSIEDGVEMALGSARYMGYSYDFNHSVHSKFELNCAELVMRTFDFITFPTTKNLGYLTIKPDEIGRLVSLGPENSPAPLKLVQFYDAEGEGKLIYDFNQSSTFDNYDVYLKANELL